MNKLLPDRAQTQVNNLQLSYASNYSKVEKDKQISEIFDNSLQGKTQHVTIKAPALNHVSNTQGESTSNLSTNTCSLQEVINIQLPYDIN